MRSWTETEADQMLLYANTGGVPGAYCVQAWGICRPKEDCSSEGVPPASGPEVPQFFSGVRLLLLTVCAQILPCSWTTVYPDKKGHTICLE